MGSLETSTYKHTFLETMELTVNLLPCWLPWGSTALVALALPFPAPFSPLLWVIAWTFQGGSAVRRRGTPRGTGRALATPEDLELRVPSTCMQPQLISERGTWGNSVRLALAEAVGHLYWKTENTAGQRQAVPMGRPSKGANWIRLQVKLGSRSLCQSFFLAEPHEIIWS